MTMERVGENGTTIDTPPSGSKVDLAIISLVSAKPPIRYLDTVVEGLEFRGYRDTTEWVFEFSRGIASVRTELGKFPEISLDAARERATMIIARIEAEMLPPTEDECAAYDMVRAEFRSLKAAESDLMRLFLRLAQAPAEMGKDLIVPLDELPPSACLRQNTCDLDLSGRACNCLKNEGLEIVAHLLLRSDGEFLRLPNFGRKSLNEIKEVRDRLLKEHADPQPPPPKPTMALLVVTQQKIIEQLQEQTELMRSALAVLKTVSTFLAR